MREVFISSVEAYKDQMRFAIMEVGESTGKSFTESGEEGEEKNLGLAKADILHLSRDAVMQTRFREKQCF